jgi:hypothetical protein
MGLAKLRIRKLLRRVEIGGLTAGLVLVVGCASPVLHARQAITLTPDESVRLEELRGAAERVRVAYGHGCIVKHCAPDFLIMDNLEAVAIWDASAVRIRLLRRALAADVEPRPAIAHELGHWLLGHTDQNCAGRAFECETAANAEAVRVLVAGWAVSHEEAVSLMYASLMGGLGRGRSLRGHDEVCREVAAFAQTFNRPLPPCGAQGE